MVRPVFTLSPGISSSVNDMAPSNARAPWSSPHQAGQSSVRAVDANALPTVVAAKDSLACHRMSPGPAERESAQTRHLNLSGRSRNTNARITVPLIQKRVRSVTVSGIVTSGEDPSRSWSRHHLLGDHRGVPEGGERHLRPSFTIVS